MSTNPKTAAWVLALCLSALAGCQSPQAVGVIVQDDARTPLPWRSLSPSEQTSFELGYAVFNTEWVPANSPAGRIDGSGPIFNAQSCDACHNSRRRGRGPRDEGEAPVDFVMQLGQRLPDGNLQRGIDEYGFVLNTSAIAGFTREATVVIQYEEQTRMFDDGNQVHLRVPRYRIENLSGAALPRSTVLMPRVPPSVQGAGLLELIPQSELVLLAESAKKTGSPVAGRISWLKGRDRAVAGRFGWQATEASVAAQTASAFSREMGLTTTLISRIDCGRKDSPCEAAPSGGSPEVAPELFDALVLFEQLHAVPAAKPASGSRRGEELFGEAGCTDCHRSSLPVKTGAPAKKVIHPYTDLLLHDMGDDLADHDVEGNSLHGEWRTAPLWGMRTAIASGQPLRLLHDGRARSIEEAILWHDGEAREARTRFMRRAASERQELITWLAER